MKKFLCFLMAVFTLTVSAYAYDSATCTISNGNGASVVAEVTGGGHNEVYLSLYNDASVDAIVTVTVTVQNTTGYNAVATSEQKVFYVKPGTSSGTIQLTKVSWNVDPKLVSVTISGARCK